MAFLNIFSIAILLLVGWLFPNHQQDYSEYCTWVIKSSSELFLDPSEWLILPYEAIYGWREKKVYWIVQDYRDNGWGGSHVYSIRFCFLDAPSGFGYYRSRTRLPAYPVEISEELVEKMLEAAKKGRMSREGNRDTALEVLFSQLVNETHLALRSTPPPTITMTWTPRPTFTNTPTPTATETPTLTPTLTLTPTRTVVNTPTEKPTRTAVPPSPTITPGVVERVVGFAARNYGLAGGVVVAAAMVGLLIVLVGRRKS
jgi:hypothetical protein